MKGIFRIAATAVAATGLVLTSALAAQAGEQASGTVQVPYLSGNNLIGSANLNGPNAPTKVCVSLLQLHPYAPDVVIASNCKTITAGTVTVSTTRPNCASVHTHVEASVNGKTVWYADSGNVVIC
ncbi:hypothetical protein GCM10010300_55950 [Streptomyces olivaceoviridis]|uniref:hypothetical protein n=1 Tax=Streptomyces olivaceoviridis TaxID=1921 RepID=UPI001674B621|nr:hypothetical protein [Streptomyces olivaceoviridis]GGZ04828.1 hypothetical protein GCM10010300_55950 [Streptomyces olivaceoviridis]